MMRCTLVAMVPVAARRRKRALGGVRPNTGARVGFRESSARRSTCRRCRSRETKVAPSRRARSSGARGSRGASFARHRSCTRRKRSGRLVTSYGHSVRARVCKNFADAKRPKRESSTRFCETFLSPQPRARPHATRRRPAHRASSLGRHGRFTELRQTCRRRRPRLGTSPLVSRASLSARTSAAAAAWISRERAWPFDTLA